MEMLWDFLDKVNSNIVFVSAVMGILGISLLRPQNDKEGMRITYKDFKVSAKIIIGAFVLAIFVFLVLCIYCNNLIIVPEIDNTSYEVAQQMLENRGMRYTIKNISEYESLNLTDAYVSLANCKGGEHINKSKVVDLMIVNVKTQYVDEKKEDDNQSDLDDTDQVRAEDVEGPFADVYVYLQEVMVYKILDGGGKTPLLSKNIEITPTSIKLYNKDYGIEYSEFSDVRDALLDMRGCFFSSIPCGKYELSVEADGYFDYSSEQSILPENLDEGKESALIPMHSKAAGELVPFTIRIYDQSYNLINGSDVEAFLRTDEKDMYQNIEVTDDGMLGTYGLLAANGVEFDVLISKDGKDYFSHVILNENDYSIVLILHDDGTTKVTTIQELYWVE